VNCYLGNVHVSPIKRLLKTYTNDSDITTSLSNTKKPKSVLLSKRSMGKSSSSSNFTLDYIKLSQMRYKIEEPAEEKLAKHALLEALFETQLWSEPYIQNPFIYITDHESDF